MQIKEKVLDSFSVLSNLQAKNLEKVNLEFESVHIKQCDYLKRYKNNN